LLLLRASGRGDGEGEQCGERGEKELAKGCGHAVSVDRWNIESRVDAESPWRMREKDEAERMKKRRNHSKRLRLAEGNWGSCLTELVSIY
jgi:hypothetical protein